MWVFSSQHQQPVLWHQLGDQQFNSILTVATNSAPTPQVKGSVSQDCLHGSCLSQVPEGHPEAIIQRFPWPPPQGP